MHLETPIYRAICKQYGTHYIYSKCLSIKIVLMEAEQSWRFNGVHAPPAVSHMHFTSQQHPSGFNQLHLSDPVELHHRKPAVGRPPISQDLGWSWQVILPVIDNSFHLLRSYYYCMAYCQD